MQVPVVATLNSPTHVAVELAQEWDITLIGYARGKKMHVYTGWQRLILQHSIASYGVQASWYTEPDVSSNGKSE